MLMAITAAVAAQCVDALANPGWHFGDVAPVFWTLMGLGVAATAPRLGHNVDLRPCPAMALALFRWRQLMGTGVAAALVFAFATGIVNGGQAQPVYQTL